MARKKKTKTYVRPQLKDEMICSQECGCILVMNVGPSIRIDRRLIGCSNMTDDMSDLIHMTYGAGTYWN